MATTPTHDEWEQFDVEGLFDSPRLHTNHLIKVDSKPMTKVEAEDQESQDFGEMSGGSKPEDIGNTYTDASVDKNHVDEMFEMDGLDSGSADDREVKADKEIDERSEESQPKESDEVPDAAKPEKEDVSEGAEEPIQKESEGVEEVAEATSKTSEDVHGGDEATKDIEDSPNAANDGQNSDNHGAESGESPEASQEAKGDEQEESGSEKGEGQSGSEESGDQDESADGSEDSATDESGEEAPGGGESEEGSQGESQTTHNASVATEEDWEAKADQSAWSQRLLDELGQVDKVRPAEAAGGGAGVDYSGESWDSKNLRTIFFKTRELIQKLLSEEDFTRRQDGNTRWWATELAKDVVSFRHPRIPSAKFDRPKDNNIVFFMDISGSVSSLAELFMAIMGGAAGLPGVRIVVGSEAHAENEIVVEKPFKSVDQAINFFRNTVNAHVCDDPHCTSCKGKIRNLGWKRPYDNPFEPGIEEYLRVHNLFNSNTTCVFFGDMQGVHFNTPELRKIVRTCKCLWLFTDEPDHHTHTGDLPKAVEAGLPIAYNVKTAKAFAKAVRKVQSIRPGLRILT